LVHALFALADIRVSGVARDPGKPLEKITEAIVLLGKIPSQSPTNSLVPAAWARMGDCYQQLPAQEPAQDRANYDNATNYYWMAINSPLADIAVRSQAEIALGKVLEKKARLSLFAPEQKDELSRDALCHYLKVANLDNLRDGDAASPFWRKEAFVAATTLVEAQHRWDVALSLYERFKKEIPSLRDFCDKKIKLVREQSVNN